MPRSWKRCATSISPAARGWWAAVLPAMVARGAGHLVITGSLSGFRGLPGALGYAASKAGVMALAESLYADLRGTGVRVQLANPGFIRTRLTAKNDFSMPFLMEPEQAAAEMLALMKSGRFKRSFPMVFSWLFRGSAIPAGLAVLPAVCAEIAGRSHAWTTLPLIVFLKWLTWGDSYCSQRIDAT